MGQSAFHQGFASTREGARAASFVFWGAPNEWPSFFNSKCFRIPARMGSMFEIDGAIGLAGNPTDSAKFLPKDRRGVRQVVCESNSPANQTRIFGSDNHRAKFTVFVAVLRKVNIDKISVDGIVARVGECLTRPELWNLLFSPRRSKIDSRSTSTRRDQAFDN